MSYKSPQRSRQALCKNKSSVKTLSYKNRSTSVRSIEGEPAILNAIAHLNRAIAEHEHYKIWASDDDEHWTPVVRIADDIVVPHRPAHHLLIFTIKEMRARDALNACPRAALRFHVSFRRVRQRWFRQFNREPPVY